MIFLSEGDPKGPESWPKRMMGIDPKGGLENDWGSCSINLLGVSNIMAYVEAIDQISRKRRNGDRGIPAAREMSWWSIICTLVMRMTGMKALMIEGNKEMVESVSLSLKLRWPEAELIAVAEGTKGMELVEGGSPDIVILDLDLPTIDAFEVLSRIRLFSDVPVIALSNNGDDEMRRIRALEMGADQCITKPFSPIEFLASVKALLRRAGMAELKEGRLPSFVSDGLAVDFTTRDVFISGELVRLPRAEYNLLTYLVKNGGKAMPNPAVRQVVGYKLVGPPD